MFVIIGRNAVIQTMMRSGYTLKNIRKMCLKKQKNCMSRNSPTPVVLLKSAANIS